MIDLHKISDAKVPIAMYVGIHDLIVHPADSRIARDMIGDQIVDY